MELRLRKLTSDDVDALTPIMKRAFDYDSNLHLGYDGGPPDYDNGGFLRRWALHPNATAYCVLADGALIGAVVLWIRTSNLNTLGCIFIEPSYENCGVGLRVWQKIESLYPNTVCWNCETPIFSHRNHHFYVNKCGFHVVAIENPKDYKEGQFKLRKQMK